jgi:hypothetical protein
MATAKPASPRSVLSQKTGANTMTFAEWLARTPDAEKFVREWVKMRALRESDWSAADVMKYLRVTYKAPFTSRNSVLVEWLARVGLVIDGRRA